MTRARLTEGVGRFAVAEVALVIVVADAILGAELFVVTDWIVGAELFVLTDRIVGAELFGVAVATGARTFGGHRSGSSL